jgi:hypothetical protein
MNGLAGFDSRAPTALGFGRRAVKGYALVMAKHGLMLMVERNRLGYGHGGDRRPIAFIRSQR